MVCGEQCVIFDALVKGRKKPIAEFAIGLWGILF